MPNASAVGGVTVVWDDAAILFVPHDPAVRAVMTEAAGLAVTAMKAAAPVSKVQPVYARQGATVAGGSRYPGDFPLRPSGYLRSSIAAFPDAEGGIIVGPTAPYAGYVNDGTPPHEIRSTGPWPLRNRATGQVFGRVVQHPGTRATHFIERAAEVLAGRRWHIG